eukprot:scaffold18711_cov119-Isochrysis_galbana.AAC.12
MSLAGSCIRRTFRPAVGCAWPRDCAGGGSRCIEGVLARPAQDAAYEEQLRVLARRKNPAAYRAGLAATEKRRAQVRRSRRPPQTHHQHAICFARRHRLTRQAALASAGWSIWRRGASRPRRDWTLGGA